MISYKATATLVPFHQERREQQVRIVRSVPGSGKSVACMLEVLYCAMEQPANKQGVRKTRFLISRSTYPRLMTTTVKTWLEWMKAPMWSFKQTVPITATAMFPLADGTRVECEVLFMAFESAADLDALKSLELTGMYVNEAHEMPQEILKVGLERTSRFPRREDGGGHFGAMVWADTNTPTQGHWLEHLERDPPPMWKYYIQPAPLTPQYAADSRTIVGWEVNPLGENFENLPSGSDYYLSRVGAMSKRELDQSILNKYGMLFAGQAVFGEWYDDDIHVLPQHTSPDPLATTYVGVDTTGLNPSAVFGQMIQGSLVVLRELVVRDTPFETFLAEYFSPFVAEHFPKNQLILLCDPANPKDSAVGYTPVQRLTKAGFKAQAARTNNWLPRRGAVVSFLTKRKGFYLDPSCMVLRQGFNGRYLYKNLPTAVTDTQRTQERPDKNEFADPQDALQYLCMHLTGPAAATTMQEKVKWGGVRRKTSMV
jgi:hypothetical protein